MRNRAVLQWIWSRHRAHEDVLAASVTGTFDRSPYPVGTMMAFDRAGRVAGSVSPGCVESELYHFAQTTFCEHERGLVAFGCHTMRFEGGGLVEDLLGPATACGGQLTVAVHPVTPVHFPEMPLLMAALRDGQPITTVLDLTNGHISLGSTGSAIVTCPDSSVFRTSYAPPMRMLICGISEIGVELAGLAPRLGYAPTVCDPRSAFLQRERFSESAELVDDWPDRYLRSQRDAGRLSSETVVVDLSHDDRFSVPLLMEALDSTRWPGQQPPSYVGALGSRARSARKRRALLDLGLAAADERRLRAPIGLDLGARLASHIALSIAAQVVIDTNSGTGLALDQSSHYPPSAAVARP